MKTKRIHVAKEIAKNKQTVAQYWNKKNGFGTKVLFKNYDEAIAFAEYRMNDGRYKNYEMYIFNE